MGQLLLYVQRDWRIVVAMHPQGHIEFKKRTTWVRGPLHHIAVYESGLVEIVPMWAAIAQGPYFKDWRVTYRFNQITLLNFHNPYRIAEDPLRGTCIEFGEGALTNRKLFINRVPFDPTPDQVVGLKIKTPTPRPPQ